MAEYGVVEKNIDKVKQWLLEGISAYKIANLLGCKSASVNKKIKEHKLVNINISKRNDNNLLKDKLDVVVELFKTKSMTEISKIVGHSEPSIYRLLKKHGYDTSKYKCKYSFNEAYFEKIDTQNKAWALGWFLSDGNVTDKGKFRIQIQEEDIQVLEDIKKDMKYDGELFYCKARNERCKPQVLLNFDRQKVAKDLIALGCSVNKSLVLTLPTFDKVPEYLFSHLLRGFFDGDGSVTVNPNGTKLRCNITSTDVFCEQVSNYLKTLDIHSAAFYYRRPNKPTGSMVFNREEAIKFLNYIYKDAELKLQRKYLKALPFLLP